ncbi:hypothetical protein HX126_20780 [Chryseobacterium indologenes]|uniref:hypothetical protein n=1 Tax=Chryseobacterium TaxID=59732 RepID=UPI001628C0DF|nr:MULTISPECIES: hypothetical protein [Chryseobacterium]MDM1556993.1 hypothetical protein [Chryseobacterium indologenes]
MPTTIIQPYYPKLSNLISFNNLPTGLDFVSSLSQDIFSNLYYKNYQASVSPLGESAFYSMSIVAKKRIEFNLVYGLKFILNKDHLDNTISSFPVTVQYNWPVIGYLSKFNLNNFSFSPQEIFKVALISLNLTESDIINQAIKAFVNTTGDPINQFVDDINAELGSSFLSPIPYPTSENRIGELVDSINAVYGEGAALAAFATYIASNLNPSNPKERLKLFFKNILPQDIDEYIREIITPSAKITLETSASIEFPRNILKPWTTNTAGELIENTDPNSKTYFDFAKAVLYADTVSGIGYDLDIAGTLNPTYSEIGNTGLLVQLDRLKLDLSKTKNIPEADAYGYSPDFTGVYARAVSVTFPPKWFYDENNPPSSSSATLRLGGYDMLVGTGGVSGTIMLESVPVAHQGGGFEYYNDKFAFNYPVSLYKKNQTTGEVGLVTANNYAELKTILQGLKAASDAPFAFKFPLSLKPLAQADPIVFNNGANYQNYLSTLNGNNAIMWKRLGGENGFQVGFKSFDVTLNKNSVVSSNIKGGLIIPKFTYPTDMPVVGGQPVQLEVAGHIEADGDFRLTAAAAPPFPVQLGNVMKLHLSSVELGKEDNKFYIGAAADIEFLGTFGELLKGQKLSISALRIYSDGHIDFRVNGGNMVLPKPIKIPLGPTEISVTAIHFGSHERERKGIMRKYNYFGFDGGVSIGVAGIDARGDGIKYYYTTDNDDTNPLKDPDSYLHIQTIHVDMVIPANSSDPNVAIKGWLSIPEPGAFQEYQGGVSLKVKNPRISGGVNMRLAPKYPAFLIDANIELPNPIALGPVSIYGFRGLLGYRYVAEKAAINMTSQNTWYEYYTAPERGVGVKKFSGPDKTEKYNFPFSLGVGALLGDTMANGNIISANAMLLLSLPSMVMVDARMKLLAKRVSFQDDPPFFAFFIFGDSSLEFGFGADYKFPESSGDIIKLYAEIQAGFFFNNPSAWYINFGTQQKPIQAKLLKDLFTLKAFLMISGKGIQAGARGEFRFDRKFGPVSIFVLAYLELGGKISFQKPQMGAYFEAGLVIDINVKIFRIYAAVSILLAVESPKPFLIYGAFTVAFKLKILFFKISFSAKLELKWEFNKEVDRKPVKPFTEIPSQEDSLVKGISMLTNETFDLQRANTTSYPDVSTIHKVVPLDTYIDIKTTKGLLPIATTSATIGGFTSPAANSTDMIPPDKVMKGLELRQVKHQYTLEAIEVMANDGESGWKKYDPFKAMEPGNTALDNLKLGQWQKKDNQYNAIRLLGMTPFSYTEQGNAGWFIPEQYGIMPSTLFCQGQTIQDSTSDFLEKPLNTSYYASSSNFFQSEGASYQIAGDVQYTVGPDGTPVMQGDHATVSDEANPHGFAQSLLFKNHSPLTIMLPDPAAKIKLKLSTYSTGVRVSYYSPLIDLTNTQSFVQYEVRDEYYSKQDLENQISPSVIPVNGITKIVITPDSVDNAEIGIIQQQMADLMDQGYQIALQQGGIVNTVYPSDPGLYAELEQRLHKLQSRGCEGVEREKYEAVCPLYPKMVEMYNNYFFPSFGMKGGIGSISVDFIKGNLSIGIYQSILESLRNSWIPTLAYELNVEQYGALLEDLMASINVSNPDQQGVLNRFELLKNKLKQINNLLLQLNLCEDSVLCNLSAYLAQKAFGSFNDKPPRSESPLLNAYNEFINNNPSYGYLNEILSRQISIISGVVFLGWMGHNQYRKEFNSACQEMISILKDLGNCSSQKKCFTLFHEVNWLSVEDHHYNIHIPSLEAVTSETKAAVDAITRSIQPVWRPDTAYYVKFTLKDTVDNGQAPSETTSYAYAFRTAGPLGFFHLDKDATYGELEIKDSTNVIEDTIGRIRDQNGNLLPVVAGEELTPHPDLYPHTSLRAYIDYQRSYPNADGNIVSAKPLFYNDETTKVSMYFTSSYASKLMDGWDEYNGMKKLGGSMKILIKDPVEDITMVNPPRLFSSESTVITSPDIAQTIEEWAVDPNPAIPPVMQQYFNMLNNGQNCTGIVNMKPPKSVYRTIKFKGLKPQKLYTAQVMNFYWGKNNNIDVTNMTEDIKSKYAKEVHKFVFQTSRYADFTEQVNSCFIKYKDANGTEQTKQAVYSIQKALTTEKIKAAWEIIQTDPKKICNNPLSQSIAMQYQHPFDRIVEGLFGIIPQEDAPTTEFNKIIDTTTGNVVAILVRNPEPFNHPRIPIEAVSRNVTLNQDGMVEVLKDRGPGLKPERDPAYSMIYSKDYSQVLIMNNEQAIRETNMMFQFIYKTWNGTEYKMVDKIKVENIKIN